MHSKNLNMRRHCDLWWFLRTLCTTVPTFMPLFVVGQAGTLVVKADDLPFEFPNWPVSANAFNFVKGAFERIVQDDKKLQGAVKQRINEFFRRNLQLCGHCPRNLRKNAIEWQVVIQLPTPRAADVMLSQFFWKQSQQFLPILGPISAAKLVLSNI